MQKINVKLIKEGVVKQLFFLFCTTYCFQSKSVQGQKLCNILFRAIWAYYIFWTVNFRDMKGSHNLKESSLNAKMVKTDLD